MADEINSKDNGEEIVLNPLKLFAFLIGAGIVAIAAGTYFNNLYINLAIPVVIMLYYTYKVYYEDEGALSIEQKADSVYYMGFIYTLVAMTASLVALANNDQLDFNSVVINFGLALTTTIIGLVVRIMWLQLDSQSLDDAESILKDRVINQTRKLSEETENIITKMTALSSQLEDATNQLTTNFDSLSESFELSTAVNSNLTSLTVSAENINTTFTNTSATLNNLNPQMEQLSQRVREAAQTPAYVREELSRLEGTSLTIMQELSTISSTLTELRLNLTQVFEGIGGEMNELNVTVGQTQTTFANNNNMLIENISNMNNSIEQLQETISSNNASFSDVMDSMLTSMMESAEAIRNRSEQLQEAINQAANAQETLDNVNDDR